MRDKARLIAAGLMVLLSGTGPMNAAQRGGGPGQPTAAPIGLIVGRVLDAGTGQPVADAEVTVTMRAPAPPPGGAGANPFAGGSGPSNVRLLTGADGRFVIRDLPAGNVQLTARAPGYVQGANGQTRPGGSPLPIAISAENKVVASTIRLWKHAAITGVITDERNEPAVNIQVRAMVRSFRQGQMRLSTTGFGRTDDRGMYRIAGLSPGDYVVVVPQTRTVIPVAAMDQAMQGAMGGEFAAMSMELAATLGAGAGELGLRIGDQMVSSQSGAMPVVSGDGRIAAYVTQYHPAASVAADAAVLSLASGEEKSGIDIRMPLVATARVSGTVIGPDGPLANVQVRLINASEPDADMLSDVARSMTAANGSFQIIAVPTGQYILKVLRSGRQALPAAVANNPQLAAMMGGRGGPVSPSDALTLFADVPLTVERDVADLAVTLSTGATVSGRLEFSGTAVVPPMTSFNVSLTAIGGVPSPLRQSPVSEDGRFTTPGTAAGKYFISTTSRSDSPGWFVKSAMVNGIDALDQPFELTTENINNVVVTFTDRRTTVTGTVIDTGNAPAQGTVIVFPASYRDWIAKGMSTRLTRNIRTQAKGAFSIPGLPARDYLIVAIPDDQVPDLQNPAAFDALARVATSLTLSDGDTRTLSLKIAQVIR